MLCGMCRRDVGWGGWFEETDKKNQGMIILEYDCAEMGFKMQKQLKDSPGKGSPFPLFLLLLFAVKSI